jgi:hypothetical protein
VNLGLGSLLKEYIVDFPESSVLWQSHNSNLSSVFTALKHYAYKPMSNDSRINTIDARTYFYMRHFLENATAERKAVALIATWVRTFACQGFTIHYTSYISKRYSENAFSLVEHDVIQAEFFSSTIERHSRL